MSENKLTSVEFEAPMTLFIDFVLLYSLLYLDSSCVLLNKIIKCEKM